MDCTSQANERRYHVSGGALLLDDQPLTQPEKYLGSSAHPQAPDAVMLRNNGLHEEIVFAHTHMIALPTHALPRWAWCPRRWTI